ncbi:hypothetical protein ACFWHR_12110 [Leucobacter sp. NPDC058333]|uniref:hypothetical protein n=1 Tax=Leucobacter sp. NPDC058333 TaxID=3346450 RepID=UPI0036651935
MEPVSGPSEVQQQPTTAAGHRKRNLWIAAGVAGALVLGGVIATPLILQNVRAKEYQALSADLARSQSATLEAHADLDAAVVLSTLQRDEVQGFGKELRELGKTADPILTKKQTASITKTAAAMDKTIGKAPKPSDRASKLVKSAKNSIQKMRDADEKAAAAAKKAKKDAPAATAPSSYLTLSLEDMRAVVNDESPEAVDSAVAPEKVTPATLDAVRADIKAANTELSTTEDAIASETDRSQTYTEAVAATLPDLVAVSESVPKQAKAVNAAAPKSGDAAKVVTTSAATVQKTAAEKAVTSQRVATKLSAYVASAKKAQQAHADQVAAEEAAAAATAGQMGGESVSETGTYTEETGYGWDTGTGGGWAPGTGGGTDAGAGGGGGGTWTPPAPPTDGGGGAPSTGGGGGGAPSTGGDGGGAPAGGGGSAPATSCPPGTYPTGSWDNITGVHCLANGTDEGW